MPPCPKYPNSTFKGEKEQDRNPAKPQPKLPQDIQPKPETRPGLKMPLRVIEEVQDGVFIPLTPRRVVVVPIIGRSGSSLCQNCRQTTCRSCGGACEGASLPTNPISQALPAPPQQLQLPAPPSRHPSQISQAPSEASHRSSPSRSGRIKLPDAPLLPSDSVSNLARRDEGLRRSAATASRSEASHVSQLTESNLRRANSVSGSTRSQRSRTERFIEEQPPAVIPPPSPSRVSYGSLRRSESSRPGSSYRQDQRLLTWSGERAPSQASHSSRRSESSRYRPSGQHEQRLVEWGGGPSRSEVSRTSSRRSEHNNVSHHSRPTRRSSYSYSDSDAAVRPHGSSRSSAVSRGSTVRDRVRDFFSGESSEHRFLGASRRSSHSSRHH